MLRYIPFILCMIMLGYGLGHAAKNYYNETDQFTWSIGAIIWGLNAKLAWKRATENNHKPK